MTENKNSDKEALKTLRESRREMIEKARQAIKTQNQDIKKIRDAAAIRSQNHSRNRRRNSDAAGAGAAICCRPEKIWPSGRRC